MASSLFKEIIPDDQIWECIKAKLIINVAIRNACDDLEVLLYDLRR